MRILGGKYGGHVLRPPMKKWPTRPTTDISKEALYNILQFRLDFEEISVLDLFGGTAMHSLEVISRGCDDVTYVDSHGPCVSWTKKIVKELGASDNIEIIKMDVKKYIQSCQRQFDYIFADPPYALEWISGLPDMIFEAGLLSENGLLVIEHDQQNNFADHQNCERVRKYGQSRFSFFSLSSEE